MNTVGTNALSFANCNEQSCTTYNLVYRTVAIWKKTPIYKNRYQIAMELEGYVDFLCI